MGILLRLCLLHDIHPWLIPMAQALVGVVSLRSSMTIATGGFRDVFVLDR